MANLPALAWQAARLGEALEALARTAGLAPRAVELLSPPAGLLGHGDEALGRWLAAAAGYLGLEAEPAEITYGEVERRLQRLGPAILRLPGDGEPGFLTCFSGGHRMVALLGPDLTVHRLRPAAIGAALCRDLEVPLAAEVDRLLVEAGIPTRRQARARLAILGERLGPRPIGRPAWCACHRAPASGTRRTRQACRPVSSPSSAGMLCSTCSGCSPGGWSVRGRFRAVSTSAGCSPGRSCSLTLVPFRLLATRSQGRLAIGAGGLLKQRLLYGALRLEPEEIRYQGAGQLLGRVLKAEAVEALALSGGLLGLVAGMELLIAAAILHAGAGGGRHALLLLAWVAVALLLGWRYWWQRRHWTAGRLTLTHDLIEGLVGHRTRLAQKGHERWHEGEDQALSHYL